MEIAEVQGEKLITGLKPSEIKASSIPEEVVSEAFVEENVTTSEALNTGMTSINLNSIFEYDFDYSIPNHKSHIPS